jgi:hypothetical protein
VSDINIGGMTLPQWMADNFLAVDKGTNRPQDFIDALLHLDCQQAELAATKAELIRAYKLLRDIIFYYGGDAHSGIAKRVLEFLNSTTADEVKSE